MINTRTVSHDGCLNEGMICNLGWKMIIKIRQQKSTTLMDSVTFLAKWLDSDNDVLVVVLILKLIKMDSNLKRQFMFSGASLRIFWYPNYMVIDKSNDKKLSYMAMAIQKFFFLIKCSTRMIFCQREEVFIASAKWQYWLRNPFSKLFQWQWLTLSLKSQIIVVTTFDTSIRHYVFFC